jgi:hypothetical protein
MAKSIHINCIYVIQSLPDQETQTGTNLHDDIIRRRTYNLDLIRSELINVSSAFELFSSLEHLALLFHKEEVVPYLHFEIHGCKSGLVLKNGDLVEWSQLRPYLIAINYNIENNLFISLATCYGAYIFSSVELFERVPFFAYIGPYEKVKEGEVEADWSCYFDTLLTTKDFNDAIETLNRNNQRVKYVFQTGEDVFDEYKKAYLLTCSTRKQRREKGSSLMKKMLADQSIKSLYSRQEIEDLVKKYSSNLPHVINELKDYYMMLSDKLPI